MTGLDGGIVYADFNTSSTILFIDLIDADAAQVPLLCKQTDLAGNISPTSTFTFTLDKDVPAAPTLSLANDTGVAGDKVTSVATLAVGPLEGGTTVAEYKLGAGGAWVTNLASATPTVSGDYTVYAKQTDLAGNISTISEFAFTFDKDAPVAPTLSLQTDSGSDGTDKITKVAALSAAGLEGGTTKAEYQLGPAGAWTTDLASVTAGLNSGTYTVNAKQTDVADNVSTPASAFTFTLDKDIPAAPALTLASDTGTPGDLITRVATLNVGGLEGGKTIAEYKAGVGPWVTDLAALTGALADGPNTVTARQTDVAGNISGETALAFTLDRVSPSPNIVFGTNKLGFAGTSSVDITFAETVVQFGLEDLSATGGFLSNFQAIDGSTYKATFNATTGFVGVGSVKIASTYSDVAGNTGSERQAGELIINATAPPGGGGGGGGGGGATPNPTTPTPNPTDANDYNGQIPALIVADFVNGGTPATAAKLADLAAFAKLQYVAYQNQGVADPGLGPYEALGRGFAETAAFQTKYGAQSESVFISTSYKAVFGFDATVSQQKHFQDQIDYFEMIYVKANLSESHAEILAKGAVLGQMLGVATLQGPSTHPYLLEASNFLIDASDGVVSYGKPLTFWDVL